MFRPFGRAWGVAGCVAQLLVLAGCSGGGGGGSGEDPEPPTVTLSASPTTVNQGQTVELTWSSTNATSCTASGGWNGNRPTSGTATSSAVFQTTEFHLSCIGAGGGAQAMVQVSVRPLPQIQISLSPTVVRAGGTSTLVWSADDATTCTASEGWSGDRAVSGSEVVGPVSQNTQYSLECSGDGGVGANYALLEFRQGPNMPPHADAGGDLTAIATTTVQLNGGGSSDDYPGMSFRWTQIGGPAVELNDPESMSPTFVAPLVTEEILLSFELTVTDDEGATGTDTIDVIVQPIPDTVTISGALSFGYVPFGPEGTGLNYFGQHFIMMSAEVLVEAIDVTSQAVLASGRFAGGYTFAVPSQREIAIRVTADMSRQDPQPLPHWQVVVRDLDENGNPIGPIHAYTTPPFDSGAGGTHDVEIPSGWDGAGELVGPRHAAPFAILEAVMDGLMTVRAVDGTVNFPELTIDWAPGNIGGDTFYITDPDGSNPRIVLSAEPDVDTDEYDPQVILHEFGHYIEDVFSRSDSFGGPHGFGDLLDMRVAFSEGFATVFGAIALGDSVYRDSFGVDQGNDSFFDIEHDEQVAEGWYSEASAWEIVWDLFDLAFDEDDDIGFGFPAIWEVLIGPQRDTDALTSMFSFVTAFKQAQPAQAPAIDVLLANEQIEGPMIDIFGSTETNDAGSPDVLPVYTPVQIGQTVQVRSTDEFGTINKLSNDRFLLLSLAAPANVHFTVSAASGRDADILIFRKGMFVGPEKLGPANEDFTLDLEAGDYVLDVYDCGNAGCNEDVPPAPTNITVTVGLD